MFTWHLMGGLVWFDKIFQAYLFHSLRGWAIPMFFAVVVLSCVDLLASNIPQDDGLFENLSSSATSLTVAPVSWTRSSHS
jgi:hypothetical protein